MFLTRWSDRVKTWMKTSVRGRGNVRHPSWRRARWRPRLEEVEARVLLANSGVSFAAHQDFAVGANPLSAAVADVNGDGRPDLVTANYSGRNVSVLLGNGNGTFQSAVNFAVGTTPYSVAVADVNGDGRPDLVTANGFGNDVSVLLGNGNGTFQSHLDFGVGGCIRSRSRWGT
jgi:hypothetical protein